jgi:hypothetical protein
MGRDARTGLAGPRIFDLNGEQAMRYLIIPLVLLTGCVAPPPHTSVTVGVSAPGVRMAVHLPAYPDMEPVPGYPVYYAPGLGYNYFFYDGLYWVYYGDYWYSSTWYNGPWAQVAPQGVPAFILRVPVRYYQQPPAYFQGWRADAAPRWGERWGRDWDQRRSGWDRWDRRAEPARAPLPLYQRAYSGQRYPQPDQQRQLNRENVRERTEQRAPAPSVREQPGNAPNIGNMPPQMRRDEGQRPAATPAPSGAPLMQEPQRREPQRDAQTHGQAPRQTASPAKDRDEDDRRGDDRTSNRGDDRANVRSNDRNNDRNDERNNKRNNSGDGNR